MRLPARSDWSDSRLFSSECLGDVRSRQALIFEMLNGPRLGGETMPTLISTCWGGDWLGVSHLNARVVPVCNDRRTRRRIAEPAIIVYIVVRYEGRRLSGLDSAKR